MDKEVNRNKMIHEASQEFAKAIQKQIGENARVSVFYIYLDGNKFYGGDSGNMNWLEKVGALKHFLNLKLNE